MVSQSSGTRPSITGGRVEVELFSADGAGTEVHIETFIPNPGYQVIGSGTGGQYANLTHRQVSNAQQYCFWEWPWAPGNIGSLELTCNTTF